MKVSLLVIAVALLAIGAQADDCRTSGCTLLSVCLPDFSGATTAFACVSLTDTCTSCTTGVCFAGNCLVCPAAVCGANAGLDASANAQLSLAFASAFDSTTISSSTSVTLSASAAVSADATLTTISAVGAYFRSLAITLGATASAQSAVVIKAGNTIWVDAVNQVAATGAIIVQVGASLNATTVSIATGLKQTVSFQASTTTTASVAWTNATYNAITLAGTAALTFTGQGLVTLPAAAASVSVSSSATIRAAGGVVLRGALGTAGFTIGGVTKAASVVQVKAQDTLTLSGAILGSTTSAQLQVYGALSFGGSSVTASLDIQGSGSTSYGSTTNNGELHITATSFTHSGASVMATSGAIIRIDHPSATIIFSKFANCSSDSYIYAQVTSVSSLAASSSGTVLKFDASSTVRANMKCNVRLYDTTGAYITMVNTNNVSAGRRLLASDGTSSWNADGTVTYTAGSTSDASSSSRVSVAAMMAAGAFAVIAAL